jgi:hypothetical protein
VDAGVAYREKLFECRQRSLMLVYGMIEEVKLGVVIRGPREQEIGNLQRLQLTRLRMRRRWARRCVASSPPVARSMASRSRRSLHAVATKSATP